MKTLTRNETIKQAQEESNLTLYNKYRPLTLDEVCGYDKVKEGIRSSFKTKKFPNLNMFLGSSGRGKTTLVNIVVKMLSCTNLDSEMNPCNKCKSCLDINEKKYSILSHFNGSGLGVDEIERIKNLIRTPNMFHPRGYQIIWIDEAQKVTKEALDRLLVETEDAPKDCYFFLTSMQQDKIPFALRNRFTKYYLNSPTFEEITSALVTVCEKEKIDLETDQDKKLEVLVAIANNCEGSFRDAISTLESVIQGNLWNYESVRDNLGIVNNDDLITISNLLLEGSSQVFKYKINQELLKKVQYTLTSAMEIELGSTALEKWMIDKLKGLTRFSPERIIYVLDLLLEAEHGYFFNDVRMKVTLGKICLSKRWETISKNELKNYINENRAINQPETSPKSAHVDSGSKNQGEVATVIQPTNEKALKSAHVQNDALPKREDVSHMQNLEKSNQNVSSPPRSGLGGINFNSSTSSRSERKERE